MTSALPRTIELKLEQTLAQWPRWHCSPPLARAPNVVAILTGGLSNFSVLVESGQRFVVRIDGLSPAANGLNRQAEWRALEVAHQAGLAPSPRYFNPDLGCMVRDYLALDPSQEPNVADVATLLRNIHQLPGRHHRLDLAERILRYEKQLEHKGRALDDNLRRCREKVSQRMQQVNFDPAEAVLCHNDLLLSNRIYSAGKLWALDWEYCAMGSRWYDIAVVVSGDSLSVPDTDTLLNTYLGRSPNIRERETLHQYSCIYRYLELLWYLALDEPVLDATVIEDKSATLRDMLALRIR